MTLDHLREALDQLDKDYVTILANLNACIGAKHQTLHYIKMEEAALASRHSELHKEGNLIDFPTPVKVD